MKNKLKKWFKRYIYAEIVGTIFALFFSLTTYSLTKNDILAAIAGAWSETIGFYGVIVIREIRSSKKEHGDKNKRYTLFSFIKNIRDLALEFGLAETLDTYIIRPFMMYIFPIILGERVIGILVGKLAADVFFYAPAIITYELQQKHKNKKKS